MTTESPTRHGVPLRVLLVALVAGLILGAVTSLSDVHAEGLNPSDVWRVLAIILNAACSWLAVAVLAGRASRRPAWAAVAGALALVVAVLAYYGYGVTWGDRSGLGVHGVAHTAESWLLVAVLAGPSGGLLGWLSCRRTWLGSAATAVVGLAVIAEVLLRLRLTPSAFDRDPVWAWTLLAMALAGLVTVAVAVAVSTVRALSRTRS